MVEIILAAVVGFLVVLSGWLWFQLRRWALVGKYGRIAIAYNRKVQLQAPLTEWYLWTRKLGENENGRVVYRNGKVTVAIVKPTPPPSRIESWRRKRHPQPAQAQMKQGTWAATPDK